MQRLGRGLLPALALVALTAIAAAQEPPPAPTPVVQLEETLSTTSPSS